MVSGQSEFRPNIAFYDTWQISCLCERGSAQCLLSFGKEMAETSLQVIGQDATAFVDLRRNTCRIVEKTRFVEPVEQVHLAFRGAAQLTAQASRNISNYVLGFLKWKPPGDAFYSGVRQSIASFYGSLRGRTPAVVSIEDATAVIGACESVIQGAEDYLSQHELQRALHGIR
jgi:hypothetical protein